jgi:hypothetical protein
LAREPPGLARGPASRWTSSPTPFCTWTRRDARLVAEVGFRAAYTTDGKAISWTSSPHALPRVPADGHPPREFTRLLAALSGR